ncbi:hypothetical protein GOP47_0010080 [Adiantum capillus-veneris]|uniref:Uncharacterized protein n=1 Tax=Adiantum capillus-veneris TaxID=13818 RepID=A0A9D4UU32_ADICA|nr:hypothetical protein GOP47_0010080 [Adiantum capillus-veneris]
MNCKKVQEQHVKLGVVDLGSCSREGLIGVSFLGRACDQRKQSCRLEDREQEQAWECWDLRAETCKLKERLLESVKAIGCMVLS